MRDKLGRFIKGHKQLNTGKTYFQPGQSSWSKGIRASDDERIKRFTEAGHKASWKGDEVGYGGIHRWIERKLGKNRLCSRCGKVEGWFDWHNTSGSYKRDFNDWERLCKSCHVKETWQRRKYGNFCNPS